MACGFFWEAATFLAEDNKKENKLGEAVRMVVKIWFPSWIFSPAVPHSSTPTPGFLFIFFPSRSSLTDSFASALLFLISKSSDSEKSQHALPKLLIFPPPPPVILHSHHCNQAQRTPYAQTYNPHLPLFWVCFLSFSLSRLRGREWGEFRQTSWELPPLKAASTSDRDAVHISGYTLRHKDTWLWLICILQLSLSLPFSPSCCQTGE